MENVESASREVLNPTWYRYTSATLGLPNYWYPVLVARDLRSGRPRQVRLGGNAIVLVRDQNGIHALADRCPHRGVPLSLGCQLFPETLTCRYHGWTFDVKTGDLAAALTDGPNSPICGKAIVRVKTYPARERAGIIWIYLGDGEPPPVEVDIPDEMLCDNAVVLPMVEERPGDWRHAMENAIDPSHGKFLHRDTPFYFFNKMIAYQTDVKMEPAEDGQWLIRKATPHFGPEDYPGVGKWPKHGWWRRPSKPAQGRKGSGGAVAGMARLPAIFFVGHKGWYDIQMFTPVDEKHHLVWQVSIKKTTGLGKLLWRIRYWTYIRFLHHVVLNRWEDGLMVRNMNFPPERLFRPDSMIVFWRKWVHDKARPTSSGLDYTAVSEDANSPLA